MSSGMYWQGDMLLTAIDQLPEGVTLRPGTVIVLGEATGHAHQLQAGRVWEGLAINRNRFIGLQSLSGTPLT